MNFISLFSGVGGIDLGLERAGMSCVAQVEIDEFCRRVLAKHWPNVERFADVKDYRPTEGAADVVAGGFPCQPFSLAGKRGGRQDERALWPHFARIIDAVRPAWVVAENVPGLRTLGADEVFEDLEVLGYACWPLVVGADDVGAPHRRKRVFIVAHARDARTGNLSGSVDGWNRGAVLRQGDGAIGASGIDAASADVPNAESLGRASQGKRRESKIAGAGSTGADGVEHAASERPERAGIEERRESVRLANASELADSNGSGSNGPRISDERRSGISDPSRSSGRIVDAPEELADSARDGQREERPIGERIGVCRWPARPGEEQHEWEQPRLADSKDWPIGWREQQPQGSEGTRNERSRDDAQTQPALGGAANGLSRRLSRWRRAALKALGNSVVPQVAEMIGRAIMAVECEVA